MDCPAKIGQTLQLDLDHPWVPKEQDTGANYRHENDDPEIAELAESINALGLLQPILVYWTGERFAVAAGFRRITAMRAYRKRYKFTKVDCKVIPPEMADLARLAENYDRKNPTTFETCRYVYELHVGKRGRRRSLAELADAVGCSSKHVGNLVRFYRSAPEEVRQAWAADRDKVFSFRALNEASKRARAGEDPQEILAGLLKPKAEAEPTTKPATDAAKPRRLTKSKAKKHAAMLESAGEVVVRSDPHLRDVIALLKVASGELSAEYAARIVTDLAEQHGIAKPKKSKKQAA